MLTTYPSIVLVHDNCVQGLAEYIYGTINWALNDQLCSLCHWVLFFGWATKQPQAYSKNGKFHIHGNRKFHFHICSIGKHSSMFISVFTLKIPFPFLFCKFQFPLSFCLSLFIFPPEKRKVSTPFSSLYTIGIGCHDSSIF